MIRAEHVNQLIVAAHDLIIMIGNIGGKIGPTAIGFHYRAIHVIAMFGRFEQRLLTRLPIFGRFTFRGLKHAFIDQPFGAQTFDCRFDFSSTIKRFFAEETVHRDAQRGQIIFDQLHHRLGGKGANFGQPNIFGLLQIGIANFIFQRLTNRHQIIPRICAIFKGNLLAMRLEIAQVNRARQNIDLRAAIIDVIFARHIKARII